MARTLIALCFLALGLADSAQAGVAGLADPMKPPATSRPVESTAGASPAAASAAALQLQALRLQGPRSLALIQGRWLAIGAAVDDARIISIDERGVRLRRGDVIEQLTLQSVAKP